MIQDNPELNELINGKSGVNMDITTTKYCKKCGKQVLYMKNDKNNNPNMSRNKEWALSLCHECYIILSREGKLSQIKEL